VVKLSIYSGVQKKWHKFRNNLHIHNSVNFQHKRVINKSKQRSCDRLLSSEQINLNLRRALRKTKV